MPTDRTAASRFPSLATASKTGTAGAWALMSRSDVASRTLNAGLSRPRAISRNATLDDTVALSSAAQCAAEIAERIRSDVKYAAGETVRRTNMKGSLSRNLFEEG